MGLWLLWSGRRPREVPLDDQPLTPREPSALVRLRDAMSLPTRMTVGLALALIGYHILAYTNPQMQVLHVPWARAWILALGLAVAVVASLGMDRVGG